MSYEAWGEPDDDNLGERASEAGYIDPDTADTLRELMKHVSWGNTPGDRSAAALTMIDHLLNPPRAGQPDDPHVLWAKTLLKDIV